MTALPERPFGSSAGPDHLLTIAEYADLGEPESGYTELIEGRVMMSPSPAPKHNRASYRLAKQLEPQLHGHLDVIQDVDVDLEFAAIGQPGSSRRPDLVVVDRDAIERVDNDGGMLRASEVLIVIEIVSPGSRRIDTVHKHDEYVDAGIPHYWIVDITAPVSLVACHIAGELGYQDAPAVTGTFTMSEPFPVQLNLDQLL